MFKCMLPAAAISLMAISSAWAVPAAAPALNQVQLESNLIEVGHRRGHHSRPAKSHRRAVNHRHSYRGRHYRHRYHSRPHDWNRRGCIMAGPVWFCP